MVGKTRKIMRLHGKNAILLPLPVIIRANSCVDLPQMLGENRGKIRQGSKSQINGG
jgi:hypothetical protein